jgi:translocation and assembly module TamA
MMCLFRNAYLFAILTFVLCGVLCDSPCAVAEELKVVPGFATSKEAASFRSICDNVRIEGGDELRIDGMEKRLICGDQEGGEIGEPWGRVPPNQAAFFLRSFLQSKGYHKPVFIQDGDVLFVRVGATQYLSEFFIYGGPDDWSPPRRRLIQGLNLTPGLLDELNQWSVDQLKNNGYGCASSEVRADPESGIVAVFLKPGEKTKIIAIDERGDTGLGGVLDRYNAFNIGDFYHEDLVTLTRRRTAADGILQGLTLKAQCTDEGIRLVRDVNLGSARLLRIGFGGGTETGARVRMIARQARVGENASSLEARIDVSFVQQFFESSARWYYSGGATRTYLEPSVNVNRQKETAFETQSVSVKLLNGSGWEVPAGQYEIRIGPNLLMTESISGTGPEKSTVGLIEMTLRWMGHGFEFYSTSPRTGSFLEATTLLTQKSWGANFTAQKFQLQGEKLWDLFHYDPPLLILGIRFNLSSVFSPDSNITSALPVQFLTFAGGESSLRGFNRQSLPRSGVGALSGAVGSVEARLHRVIFKQADVFAFNDMGALGGTAFRLERPLFMSPGVGLRWESPIGVFRAYAAERFTIYENPGDAPYDRAWRLGLTYGEEF